MASFYLSFDAFNKIYNSNSVEFQIMTKQKTVYLDLSDNELDSYMLPDEGSLGDETNPLFDFQQSYANVSYKSGKQLFEDVKNDLYDKLYTIPDGIFILDVNEKKAKDLSKQYGVICISSNNIDLSFLTSQNSVYCEREIKKDYDGEAFNPKHFELTTIIPGRVLHPSNTIIVIDKYLFKDDPDGNSITKLLSFLLKKELKRGICQVLIIFQNASLQKEDDRKKYFKNIVEKMYDTISDIHKLDIELEFFAGDYDPSFWDDMHNRKIITNYSILSAEHGLGMYLNKKMRWDQKITVESLYSQGLTTCKQTTEDQIGIILKKIRFMIENAKKKFDKNTDRPKYRYSRDRNTNPNEVSPSDITNRLVINNQL